MYAMVHNSSPLLPSYSLLNLCGTTRGWWYSSEWQIGQTDNGTHTHTHHTTVCITSSYIRTTCNNIFNVLPATWRCFQHIPHDNPSQCSLLPTYTNTLNICTHTHTFNIHTHTHTQHTHKSHDLMVLRNIKFLLWQWWWGLKKRNKEQKRKKQFNRKKNSTNLK